MLIDSLIGRVSCPKLKAPAPSPEILNVALAAASRAPDHGKLRPWHFYLFEESELNHLGYIFSLAANEIDPGNEAKAEKAKSMPLRAPMLLVATAKIIPDLPKIPREEQLMAAACAVHNLQHALWDRGFGTMWRTGEYAYHPLVKDQLGLEEMEEIIGFIYVGTPESVPNKSSPQNPADILTSWSPN